MTGVLGSDGSPRRVAERCTAPVAMLPRAEFTIGFADGGTLALGRRTAVMGVLNVTPDSFSDGGLHFDPARALAAAVRMAEGGADLIDVGGESTRPGAAPVDEAEETRRVVPVIEAIKRELSVRVSVDTMKASVARRAFDAGADMLNDISALGDPEMLPLLRERRAPAVLMHMRGTPATMQSDTRYDDLVGSVVGFLEERVARASAGGIADDKILVDPGVGFGKAAAGNLSILRELSALEAVGKPILIGASRKSFIGAVLDLPADDRLEGSLAVAAFASAQGAHVIRAHDVEETVRVVRMIDAIRDA
jgi:dihydropteroate synthase